MQFRVLHLFAALAVIAAGCAVYRWLEHSARQRNELQQRLEAMGGTVRVRRVGPTWLPDRYRRRIEGVRLRDVFSSGGEHAPTSRIGSDASAERDPFGEVGSADQQAKSGAYDQSDKTRAVPVSELEHVLRSLRDAPFLSSVDLSNTQAGDRHLSALLAACPRIRQLDLTHTGVTKFGLRQLTGFRQLTDLSLNFTDLDDDALSPLGELYTLRRLRLMGTEISDAGLVRLKSLTQLIELDVSLTRVAGPGCADLEPLRELKVFRVAKRAEFEAGIPPPDTTFLDEFAESLGLPPSGTGGRTRDLDLTTFPLLPQLAVIELTGADLADGTLERLASLPNLKSLKLQGCNVNDAGLLELRPAIGLERLQLDDTQVSGESIAVFQALPNLTTLYLRRTQIRGNDLKRLADLRLQGLHLAGLKLNPADLGALTAMDSLVYLGLAECHLSDTHLPRLWNLPNLRFLDIRGNSLSDDAVDRLRQEMPGIRRVFH